MFAEITTALQILHWVVFDLEIKLGILTFAPHHRNEQALFKMEFIFKIAVRGKLSC